MLLFAEAASIEEWLRPLANYGILGLIAAGVFYFVVWYGRRMLEGHLSYMDVAKECMGKLTVNQEQQTETLAKLTENLSNHEANCAKLPKMLGHIAEAGIAATDCKDVHRHLDRVIDERDR